MRSTRLGGGRGCSWTRKGRIMSFTYSASRDELVEYDKQHLWHPFTQMKEWTEGSPLLIARGEGNCLVDVDGKRYLDGVSSLWANVHGHGRTEINEAIASQLKDLAHSTLLGLSHPSAALLAHRLAELTPGDLRWAFYSESGSTAVEIAIKMAFQYWQNLGRKEKTRFMSLREGYHGDTIGAVSVGGIDLFHQVYGPLLFNGIKAPCPYRYCQENDIPLERGTERLAAEIEALMKAYADETAAFILEPLVQGAGGILPFPPGLLKRIEELCRRHDVLLIADEVAVGFGRTGTMFACEQESVVPDFMCLGKGITGGYLPLAATMTTQRIYDGFWGDYQELKTFFHGHTYTGNPLACAAALASLDLFQTDKTIENLPPKIARIEAGLDRLAEGEHVGDVRQRGMMAGVELVLDRAGNTAYPVEERIGHKVCMAVREHGVILRNLGDAIVLMPLLSLTIEELDRIFDALENAIRDVCG